MGSRWGLKYSLARFGQHVELAVQTHGKAVGCSGSTFTGHVVLHKSQEDPIRDKPEGVAWPNSSVKAWLAMPATVAVQQVRRKGTAICP